MATSDDEDQMRLLGFLFGTVRLMVERQKNWIITSMIRFFYSLSENPQGALRKTQSDCFFFSFGDESSVSGRLAGHVPHPHHLS